MDKDDEEIFKYITGIAIIFMFYILVIVYYLCCKVQDNEMEIELASAISSSD